MLTSNIPLNKLKNELFCKLWKNIQKIKIPDESVLISSNYFDKTINCIQKKFEKKNILASIDENSDVEGRYIANVIVGS